MQPAAPLRHERLGITHCRPRSLSSCTRIHDTLAAGGYPALDSPVLAAFPALSQVLPAMQAAAGDPPAALDAAEVVDSLDGVIAAVEADPRPWCV